MEIPAGWVECKECEKPEGIFAQGKVYVDGCWSRYNNQSGLACVDVRAQFDGWVTIPEWDMAFHGWKFVKKVPFDPCRDHRIFRVMEFCDPMFGTTFGEFWRQYFIPGKLLKISIEYVDETTNDVVE